MNRESELPKWEVIPMDLIDPLARKIAVAWMECDDRDWIGNKHKLASDLMNYAHHICTGMKNAAAEQKEELARERAIGFLQFADGLYEQGKRGLFDRGFGMTDINDKLENLTTDQLYSKYEEHLKK